MTDTLKTNASMYTCSICDYNSKWKHNVTRHMVTNHPSTNIHAPSTNIHAPSTNIHATACNTTGNTNTKECMKCKRVFAKRCTMLTHVSKCKGVQDRTTCEYCHNKYASYKSRMNHVSRCPVKKEIDSKALVPVAQQQAGPVALAINNNNITINGDNIQNNNNTQNNNTQNNTQNITNNNIIVFQQNKPFLYDHISKKALRNMLKANDYSDLLTAFSEEVLKRKENQCVRKTNLRSTSNTVHVGNDVWEARTDKQVMPKLLSNLAMSFSGSMDMYKLAIQKALDQFIEDVMCDGEHGTDDANEIAHMQKLYKSTMNNVKHILFNVTKQTMGERKAQAMLDNKCG